MRHTRSVMAAWTVIAVPLLIMFFALGMERVEARLRREGATGAAAPRQAGSIVAGIARARTLLRGQRRRRTTPAPMAITALRDDFVGSNEETIEIRLPMNEVTTQLRPVAAQRPPHRSRSRAS